MLEELPPRLDVVKALVLRGEKYGSDAISELLALGPPVLARLGGVGG